MATYRFNPPLQLRNDPSWTIVSLDEVAELLAALNLRWADLPIHRKDNTVNRGVSLSSVSHTVRSLNHAEPYAAGAPGQS
jgi:hypothetical protein